MVDWVVLDVGPLSMQSGIVGYLHGEFNPAMRLLRVAASTSDTAVLPFYSGFEVGYCKDILQWWGCPTRY